MSRSSRATDTADTTVTAVAAQTTYEASVIARALDRAGRNPQLKGHLQELLVQDLRNIANLGTGRTTALTRSTTAEVVDLVTTRGGKVLERIQVKDVTSASGVNKIVHQVVEGKYRTTQLVGSPETTELVNAGLQKAGVAKRMVSSGASTQTTTGLAQRAGAMGSGSLGNALGTAARNGGTTGAVVGVGVELVKGVSDLMDGSASGGEVAGRVAKAGVKGYAAGAAASAAATASGAAVATGLGAVGAGAGVTLVATVGAPIAAAVAVGWLATKAVEGIFSWFD